jgi:NSS family neurotransmitter:Na+ symporter
MAGGTYIGILFFLLVLFAALTSSISLMETVVSILCDKLKIGRKLSCLLVFVFSVVLGLLSSLGYGVWAEVKIIGLQFLDFFDFISNSVLMPVVAFFTCVFVGYVIKPEAISEEVELSGKFRRKALFNVVIKYIAPVCIVLILISSVLEAFGVFKI